MCGNQKSPPLFLKRCNSWFHRKASWVPQPRGVNLQNCWNCTTDQQISDMDAGHAWMHAGRSEPPQAGNWRTHLRVGRPPFWSPDEVRKQSYEQEQEPRSFSYQSWKTKNKTKQNFIHWKKSLTQKDIGSSPAIVLLPRSKKQMWIWTEETDNWINLSQKSPIHLLSRECRSLTPVSGFHPNICCPAKLSSGCDLSSDQAYKCLSHSCFPFKRAAFPSS